MSTEKPENAAPAVSSAQQFLNQRKEREEGKVVTLPSGLLCRVKRPSIQKLLRDGHIPSDVAAGLANQTPGQSADINDLLTIATAIAKEAFVDPQIVDEPDYAKGQIAVTDLDENDLAFIVTFVQTGNEDIAKFRQ